MVLWIIAVPTIEALACDEVVVLSAVSTLFYVYLTASRIVNPLTDLFICEEFIVLALRDTLAGVNW